MATALTMAGIGLISVGAGVHGAIDALQRDDHIDTSSPARRTLRALLVIGTVATAAGLLLPAGAAW